MIERLNGSIAVESDIGRGSVFRVEIPFQKAGESVDRLTVTGSFPRTRETVADGPTSPGDAAAAEILDQLERLLADDNTAAGDLFDRSRDLIEAVLSDVAKRLSRQIQEFDYAKALATLRRFRGNWSV